MVKGSSAITFYREVDDAIARNPPNVGDLVVLKKLCEAVEADDKSAVARLTRELVNLSGVEDPLHAISYELFHAVMARILLSGWFEEFDLLINWPQTRFGTKNERVADNWNGIVTIVKEQPRSLGLLTEQNREKEWQRTLNGLDGAMRHFAKVDLPPAARMGAPPEGPTFYERILPEQLLETIEQFYRILQILFQQMLELAVVKLERDNNDAAGLRKLQDLQLSLWILLSPKDIQNDVKIKTVLDEQKVQNNRRTMVLNKMIRVAEFRYGRSGARPHRFLDAFPPHASRSVIFNSLDREDREEPYVRGERIGSIQVSRDRQLAYFLVTYGHTWDPNQRLTQAHLFRRALIKGRHGGRLRLVENDELIAFLYSFFAETLAEFTRQAPTAVDKSKAGVNAWRATVDMASVYFGQVTTHSRLNLTEGPPNYLTHTFPRNLIGRLLQDCGVHAVRSAYILLSVLNRINGVHAELAGPIRARWVRLPLHVGMLIQTGNFGVVVQHNEYASVTDNDELSSIRTAWERQPHESDPSDPNDATLKFHEDLTANGFSSDLDMPISSIPILEAGEPVTTHTIWNSYQKKVVPSQLFTRLVGASNAPQYQFDVRYLRLSELEREWYNRHVLRFWNTECFAIWESWASVLTSTKISDKEYEKHKQAYMKGLNEALDRVEDSYEQQIRPKKDELSDALRADSRLLLPRVRIVSAARLETVLPAVEKVVDHLNEISQPGFRLKPDFAPPFARKEEVLLEVP
ncbi:hypothetical protein SO078_27800 (plasmid) [Sinorhizobium meliloti]|uniref:hypothetical protein n=1 Tax=Rhizobium meliloti TaxID=382 RepID=UPI002D781BF1|nr:hypothetical protein [Sinorhizobium meliloti]WRQ71047.1 hypothetical protein SO078_27800 [Sinorhizobium meliloti]